MRKTVKLFGLGLIIGIAGFLSGCAATPTVGKVNVPAPEKIQACQLSTLALEVTDDTPGKKNQEFVKLLEDNLKSELSSNGIQTAENAEETLKVSLKDVHLNGFIKEFIMGPFAGRSCVKLDAVLSDKAGVLAQFPLAFYGNTRGMSQILKSPEEATKNTAKEIVKKLMSLNKNSKPKGGE
jgi:hypothetical protein